MIRNPMTRQPINPAEGLWLYRTGGVSALILGLSYLVIIGLYVPLGAPPSGAEARLAYLSANTNAWWAILGLSVFTDFLFVPMALSLYIALEGLNKYAMLLATACVALFVFLDLALTWTNYAALIAFSGKYAMAAGASQRAAVVEIATYPSAILESGLLFVYNSLVLAAGILLTGFVMLKGIFSKGTAYLGLFTGLLGITSVVGSFVGIFSSGIILTSLLTTIWVLFVGHRLIRLSGQSR